MLSGSGVGGVLVAFVLLGFTLAAAGPARADTIDLNDFFTDPSSAVSINASGSSATLTEDISVFSVLLTDDPWFGDPELIIAQLGRTLSFDYDFTLGSDAGEADQFAALLIDSDTGLFVGGAYEFFLTSTGSGSISWDLSSFVGTTLGLQFELDALFGDAGLGSTLTISNLQFTDVAPVPEPATIFLLGAPVAAAWLRRRRAACAIAARGAAGAGDRLGDQSDGAPA